MSTKCSANFNQEGKTIWAGYSIQNSPFPDRQEGYFYADSIEANSTGVEGNMVFPQRCRFEFNGPMDKLLRALKQAQGARACLQIPGLSCYWMD